MTSHRSEDATNAGVGDEEPRHEPEVEMDVDNGRSSGSDPSASDLLDQSSVPTTRPSPLSEANVNILEELWSRGLDNTKTAAQPLLDEALERTKLKKKQIQNWIGKKQKQKKRDNTASKKKRRKPFKVSTNVLRKGRKVTEEQRLRNAFKSKFLTGKEMKKDDARKKVMSDMSSEWEAKKDDLAFLASLKEWSNEPDDTDQSPVEEQKAQKAAVKAIIAHVTILCNYLKDNLGYEAAFAIAHPYHGIGKTGTGKGVAYLTADKEKVLRDFLYHIGGRDNKKVSKVRKELLKRLQSIYNSKYEEQTGKQSVEYTKIQREEVKLSVSGLPNGLPFKQPKLYKNEELKAIIGCCKSIKMKVEMVEGGLGQDGRSSGAVADIGEAHVGGEDGSEAGSQNQVVETDEANVERVVPADALDSGHHSGNRTSEVVESLGGGSDIHANSIHVDGTDAEGRSEIASEEGDSDTQIVCPDKDTNLDNPMDILNHIDHNLSSSASILALQKKIKAAKVKVVIKKLPKTYLNKSTTSIATKKGQKANSKGKK